MGDHTESEEDIKIDIKEASIDLIYIKEEPKEEIIDLDENCHAGTSGESSVKKELEVYGDDLLDPLDTDIIMENEFVKLEDIKGESRSFETFHCNKCNKIYKGYCIKCSTLSRILNKIPTDILEIRDTSMGKGVFLLKPLPKNIIFGPFEGVPPIESTKGYSWKIKDKKLVNIDNGSWIKDITSAVNALIRNLDIFQFDGKLYLETIREVVEGDELLIYYNDEEIQASDNSEECYFIPQKRDELPKAFACTLCCYGFSSDECLVEHKSKCPHAEQNADVEDFELTECACCKIWLEKQEYQDYHMAYCWRKNQRMFADHPKSDVKTETNVGKMNQNETDVAECFEGELNENSSDVTTLLKRHDRGDNLQLGVESKRGKRFVKCPTKDHQSDSGSDTHNDVRQYQCDICTLKFAKRRYVRKHVKNQHTTVKDYKCSECSYGTNKLSNLKVHLNTHIGIKPFQCDICLMKFVTKQNLTRHIENQHAESGSEKKYKCSESKCSYQTNHKQCFQQHLNKHNNVKPFECDMCTREFTRNTYLLTHKKNKHSTPGREKDYKCSTFSKLNTDNDVKVEPFECDICMMKFTWKASIIAHKKEYHSEKKNYKCSECPFQTKYKQSIQEHLNKHSGIKPFECDICMTKYTRKKNLTLHMKNIHETSKD